MDLSIGETICKNLPYRLGHVRILTIKPARPACGTFFTFCFFQGLSTKADTTNTYPMKSESEADKATRLQRDNHIATITTQRSQRNDHNATITTQKLQTRAFGIDSTFNSFGNTKTVTTLVNVSNLSSHDHNNFIPEFSQNRTKTVSRVYAL
jgi:hypothetical protein